MTATRPTVSTVQRLSIVFLTATLLAAMCGSTGCTVFGDAPIDRGVVRTEQADVYSSTALVALKVATVKRGDIVDIMQREAVVGPTYTENWLQIRLKDDAETTGWIEARHVVTEGVVTKSADAAGKREEVPTIARGRLKVNQKLRLAPGRDTDVAVVLTRGTEFDITGKVNTTYKPPKPSKPGANPDDEPEAEDMEEPEEQTDTWYRVRLDEGSIIEGGWLLAQSVSLQVPDEILHLEGNGRRFVAWLVVGTVTDDKAAAQDPENAKRNNYITFMRRGDAPPEVDFDRLYAVFWSNDGHTYTGPYVESDMRGVFPVSQEMRAGRPVVTIHVLDASNKPVPVEYEVAPDDKGRMDVKRLTPPIPGEHLRSH